MSKKIDYKYQEIALRALLERLEHDERALLVMAPGLGKTRIAARYAKDMVLRGRGLVLCHDSNILEQNMREFRNILGDEVSLGMFTGIRKDLEEVNVLFATFQTFREWKDAFFTDEFYFIIVDEAHHTEANTFRPVVEYFTPRHLLGMTATPDRMDDRDIRDTFGVEAVSVSLEDGIVNGWLVPVEYKVLTDHTSTRRIKALLRQIGEGDRKVSVKQMNETIFIEQRDEEIARIITGYEKPAIIFCASVEHAENFANYLPSAVTFHSGKSNQDNDQALRYFRDGKVRYILAVDKFNEGIDVPEVELIVFLRSTGSRTIFLQQLGRGLRRVEGKEKVTVLDFVANCDRVIMVQQMVREVARVAREKFDLDKGQIHLEGNGFSFDFDENVKDILEIIRMVMTKLFISDIPHLLAEYDTEKNPLPAEEVRAGTYEKLWWKCSKPECGWKWQAKGSNRVMGGGCPACSGRVATPTTCMKVTHPDLVKEFHPTKNDPDTTESLKAGTGKKLWWKCKTCGHEWQATGAARKRGRGCPACNGKMATPTTCMKVTHPDLVKEFHPTKNAPDTTESLKAGTEKKLWWKCKTCGHEWQASGANRSRGTGCPACAGQVVTPTTCMKVTHPDLVKEFHPTKNAPDTTESVVAGTNKKLWWKCSKPECGHEWQSTSASRMKGAGCPACSGRVATPNTCLKVTHPDIAEEFHPSRNGKKTPKNLKAGTQKKVWWKCKTCQHEWLARGRDRVRGQGCPACANNRRSERMRGRKSNQENTTENP